LDYLSIALNLDVLFRCASTDSEHYLGSASPLPAWGEATLSSHRNTSVQPATSLPKQINQEQCQLDSTGATVDLVNLCMGYITSANGTQPIANPCCAKFLQDYHG
jgi:hypothetical protein